MNELIKLISLLRGPDNYAHQSGKEMADILNQGKGKGKGKRYKSMLKIADIHFSTVMEIFDDGQIVRIVKTWLSVYQLPLAPGRLKTFEQFHGKYHDYILQNANSISNY